MSTVKGQVGWFVYTRTHGRVNFHKYDINCGPVHKDTKQYHESRELIKFPLTAEEYMLSLDTLKARYPLPEKLQVLA